MSMPGMMDRNGISSSRGTGKSREIRRPRALSRIAPLVGGLALAASLFGCRLPSPYSSAYYDTSVNFIAGITLDTFDTTGSANGKWTFSYLNNTSLATTYPYMTLEEVGTVGSGAPTGLATTAKTYRLRIANLLKAGDFEPTTSVPSPTPVDSGWSAPVPAANTVAGATNAAVLDLVSGDSKAEVIHGKTLHVHLPQGVGSANPYEYAVLPLTSGVSDLSDLSWSGTTADFPALYSILFNWQNNVEPVHFYVSPNDPVSSVADSNTPYITGTGLAHGTFATEAYSFQRAAGDRTKLIVGQQAASADLYLDDVRAIRSDLDLSLKLSLMTTDTSPSLGSGYYRFSVWVKDDDAASDVAEPYRAQYVYLEMTNPVTDAQGSTTPVSIARPTAGWASWTQLTIDFPENNNLQITDTTKPALELKISPCDYLGNKDTGNILISTPSLQFFINGY